MNIGKNIFAKSLESIQKERKEFQECFEQKKNELFEAQRKLELEMEKFNQDTHVQESFVQKQSSALDQLLSFTLKKTGDKTEKNKIKRIENVVLTSPTQNGKTSYVISAISATPEGSVLSVYVCDNFDAQLLQLQQRLNSHGIEFFLVSVKKNLKTIQQKINEGKNALVVMLNNASQVEKLSSLVKSITGVKKFNVFLDEGDTIIKSDQSGKEKVVAKSETEWNKNGDLMQHKACDGITKVWITATPDSIFYTKDILSANTIVLPISPAYVPVNIMEEWKKEDNSKLQTEITRIKEARNGEIVLYCTESLKNKQKEAAVEMSKKFGCLTMCYNGDGIALYKNGSVVIGINAITLADYLTKIKGYVLEHGLIIVGYKLLDRGISFSSLCLDKPLTATVIFYSGGKDTYAVSLAQRLGRATGTSRPDLVDRKVFASKKTIENYKAYLFNLNIATQASQNKFVYENYTQKNTKPLSCKVDRPYLGFVNKSYTEDCKVCVERNLDLEKMKRLVNSWRLESNTTQVARLFRKMVSSGGRILSGEVKEIVPNEGAYFSLTGEHERERSSVFRKDSKYHYIRDEVREYLTTL